ncbi:hypothetical protein AAMO2058_000485800 [Amorphochlora amoebiformis]|uniref:Nucleosome assembly protein n=1 Tax=Amorphochlora amoebiformis TaxID=1561963 RepID=A0A7S0DR08_9EUKA|mmetsp:Transcript_6468/g.9935  ORF Transcript_6468/g.9935 Transcript_6468/m.9935 type:complete len:402 (+) Transcript_6468:68-1273(+)
MELQRLRRRQPRPGGGTKFAVVLLICVVSMCCIGNLQTSTNKVKGSSMHLQRWTSAVSDPRFSLGRLKGGFTGEVSNTEDKGENVAIDLLDPAVRPHAQRIREKEREYQKLFEKYIEDLNDLERKLSNDSKEIFQRRKESVEKVPDFWMMALTGHPETRKAISESDVEILSYVEDVSVEILSKPRHGFTIHFHFRENPYFEHSKLSKTYILVDLPDGDFDIVGVEVNPEKITWKVGCDPRRGEAPFVEEGATVMKTVAKPSFFHWFSAIDVPPLKYRYTVPPKNQPYDRLLREALAADIAIAHAIKDDVVPHALDYYTGEAGNVEEYDYREISPEEKEARASNAEIAKALFSQPRDEMMRRFHAGAKKGLMMDKYDESMAASIQEKIEELKISASRLPQDN